MVIDPAQHLHELIFDQGDLSQSQGRLIKLGISNLGLDDAVDQFANALRRRLLEGTGRRLDRIGQHGDGRLTRLGLRPGIHEIGDVDRISAVFFDRLVVEKPDALGAVVLADKVRDDMRHLGLIGHATPFNHMLPNDGGRHFGLQTVVGVATVGLVFDEEMRLEHLADVVIVQPDPAQQPVGADRRRGGLSKVGHVDRVRVGPRGFHRQALQQRTIRVSPLQQGLVGRDVGEPFEDGYKAHRDDRAENRVGRSPGQSQRCLARISRHEQAVGQNRTGVGRDDDGDEDPRLRPSTHSPHGKCGRGASHEHGQGHVLGVEAVLLPGEHREGQGEHRGQPAIPKYGDRECGKRDGQGLDRPGPARNERRCSDIDGGQGREQQQPARVGIDAGPEEHDQQAEHAEHEQIA